MAYKITFPIKSLNFTIIRCIEKKLLSIILKNTLFSKLEKLNWNLLILGPRPTNNNNLNIFKSFKQLFEELLQKT